eukprot:scaffold64779_cov18-Tisochrysis_lutea.AAC.2
MMAMAKSEQLHLLPQRSKPCSKDHSADGPRPLLSQAQPRQEQLDLAPSNSPQGCFEGEPGPPSTPAPLRAYPLTVHAPQPGHRGQYAVCFRPAGSPTRPQFVPHAVHPGLLLELLCLCVSSPPEGPRPPYGIEMLLARYHM